MIFWNLKARIIVSKWIKPLFIIWACTLLGIIVICLFFFEKSKPDSWYLIFDHKFGSRDLEAPLVLLLFCWARILTKILTTFFVCDDLNYNLLSKKMNYMREIWISLLSLIYIVLHICYFNFSLNINKVRMRVINE